MDPAMRRSPGSDAPLGKLPPAGIERLIAPHLLRIERAPIQRRGRRRPGTPSLGRCRWLSTFSAAYRFRPSLPARSSRSPLPSA